MKFPIRRDSCGVPHIAADSLDEMYHGLGYAHGHDRGLQAIFMRVLGQGRVSELLSSSDSSLGIDRFFRRMNWSGGMANHLDRLTDQARLALTSYTEGFNHALGERSPWEFTLLGYRPEPWTCEDSLLVIRMTGYLTLAQSQEEMERLFVEMVQAGVPDLHLHDLFPGILGRMDRDLIMKIETKPPPVVPAELWDIGVPRMMASNSWVLAGNRTRSGSPLLANDPHLEVNRLPNIWYEVALRCKDRYAIGATMPGIPGLLVGRTNDIAVGATYSFMDATDSWIERCKDGTFFRDDEGWLPFVQRTETILRKKKEPVTVTFFENHHGTLEGDPTGGEEKYLLSRRWSGSDAGAESLNALAALWSVGTVGEAMETIGPALISFNWVFADTEGSIGYQMTGGAPQRRKGARGFVPLPGWDRKNDWKGYVDPLDLPREINPDSGLIVTSNQDLNHLGKSEVINIPMAPYRADRITSLLGELDKATSQSMNEIQGDLYSREAEAFMRVLRPLLPDTTSGKILAEWDCHYTLDSKGAFLFERFYQRLRSAVFGSVIGEEAELYLGRQTGIYADFYLNFNRVLLSADSPWFGEESQEEIYRRAAAEALDGTVNRWGASQRVTMAHVVLGGQLPGFLGFDRGPVELPGGRATVNQGQIFRSAGRTTSFAPSLRFATDMAAGEIHSNLAGGPSDRRFSKWYYSNMERWQANEYKTITPDLSDTGERF